MVPMAIPLSAADVAAGVNTPLGNVPVNTSGAGTTASADPRDAIRAAVWAVNDYGSKGLTALHGSTSQFASAMSIMLCICVLLPIDIFAPNYVLWNKCPISSLAIFVDTMKKVHPAAYAEIVAVTKLKGDECRDAMRAITTKLFGMFGNQVHTTLIYAAMIFVWSQDDSTVKDQMFSMLLNYARTNDGSLGGFKTKSAEFYSAPFQSTDMSTTFMANDLYTTDAWSRLSYERNPTGFAAHWQYLWEAAIAVVCKQPQPTTVKEAMKRISLDHFPQQGESE